MEKVKTKFQESKIYKTFRRLTSLGLAGILAVMFPNEIVAWLSAGAGFLFGKGIISFALMSAIVTFLGSALGLVVQKVVLCGLTFLFSNIILKQTRKLFNFVKGKIKKNSIKNNVIQESKPLNKQKEAPKLEKTTEIKQTPKVEKTVEVKQAPEVAPKVKTLGIHPAMKK